MTASPIVGYTRKLKLNIINYLADVGLIQKYEAQNVNSLDNIIGGLASASGVPIWANSTTYSIGDRAIDISNGFIRVCVVPHTSPLSGTFADALYLNPSYWLDVTQFDISGVFQPFAALIPTTPPTTGGVVWNNGGVLCVSLPYTPKGVLTQYANLMAMILALPTTAPYGGGLWVHNGVVSINNAPVEGLQGTPFTLSQLGLALSQLPTTPPAQRGVVWNNGGVISVS